MVTNQNSTCYEREGGLIGKEHIWKSFGVIEMFGIFDMGGSYVDAYICKNSLSYTLKSMYLT